MTGVDIRQLGKDDSTCNCNSILSGFMRVISSTKYLIKACNTCKIYDAKIWEGYFSHIQKTHLEEIHKDTSRKIPLRGESPSPF